MPTYTTNLNLTKPLLTESYNVGVANANNDILDTQVFGKMAKDGSNSAVTTLSFSGGATFTIDPDKQILNIAYPDGTTANVPSEFWFAEGKATEPIAEGDNVMLAGSQGDYYLVKKAVAAELVANPHLYLGVATKSSATNGWAKITRWGLVNNIGTNGWPYGTRLYFNPATGGFTNTLPALPNVRIEIGMVVKQHLTAGAILVLPEWYRSYTTTEIDGFLAGKAALSHTHTIANITNLQSSLDAKQATLVNQTNIKSVNGNTLLGSGNLALEETIVVALSDETTAITAGTNKAVFRMPFACKLTIKLPRANVNTASSSGLVTVNINKNGTSILNTKLSIDTSEKTSVTAATPTTLVSTPTVFADDDEITFDIDAAGTGAKGLKVTLFVERT